MSFNLADKVFYRAAAADGGAVSIALITGWGQDGTANLAVKPDQGAWFDAANVPQFTPDGDGTAACWSGWLTDLQPAS